MRIFDPRSIRAMGKGPQAEAEVVTGTHLYAYLQDLELPAALVKSRGNRSSGSRRGSDDNRRNATHKMFCTAERFAAGEGSGANSPAPETNSTYEIEYQESSKRSLLQEIKVMKDAFLRAFYNIHDRISSDMSIDCHTDPLRLDSLSEEPLLPSNHTIFEGTSLISGINQTQRSSIICSDDMLVTDFKIVVRDQSFCTDIGGRSSSDSEAAESSRCKNITLDTALLSALIVSDSGIRNSHLGSEEFAEETLDLLVMCRSNPNIINNNNKSNNKNNNDNSSNNKCNNRSDDDLQTLYCARVRLSSADGVGIFRSALGGKDGVQKVKLYVVPVLPQQSAPNRFPECCSDDGNREEYEDDNCSVAEVNSYDSSVDDEINQRVAAIVGLGTVDQNESDACSGPRTCLFQIDVKDLRFFAINQSDSISDRSIQTSSSEKYVRTALAASTINSDILLAMQLQYIGDGENEVRFRRRLLSMDLPEDRDALLFEACAARGVVIVGNTSMAGSLGGKVTVVDMVVDEDEDEDEDDSNADDSDHDIDLQNSQLEIAETVNDSCITMTE